MTPSDTGSRMWTFFPVGSHSLSPLHPCNIIIIKFLFLCFFFFLSSSPSVSLSFSFSFFFFLPFSPLKERWQMKETGEGSNPGHLILASSSNLDHWQKTVIYSRTRNSLTLMLSSIPSLSFTNDIFAWFSCESIFQMVVQSWLWLTDEAKSEKKKQKKMKGKKMGKEERMSLFIPSGRGEMERKEEKEKKKEREHYHQLVS